MCATSWCDLDLTFDLAYLMLFYLSTGISNTLLSLLYLSYIFYLNFGCSNSNSNSTFIALNLRQKTDSKAHHTKTLFNIQKPETLQGSAPRRKQKGDWKFRVGMLFQRGMTSTLT